MVNLKVPALLELIKGNLSYREGYSQSLKYFNLLMLNIDDKERPDINEVI